MSKGPTPRGRGMGKKFSTGGKAGRSPGRGLRSTTTPGKAGAGSRPPKGFGSKKLGGRPPGGTGGGGLPI